MTTDGTKDLYDLTMLFDLAVTDDAFRQKFQTVLDLPDSNEIEKSQRRSELQSLFTDYKIDYSDARYDAVSYLYLNDDLKGHGETFDRLRQFATAFGHPNVGTFN